MLLSPGRARAGTRGKVTPAAPSSIPMARSNPNPPLPLPAIGAGAADVTCLGIGRSTWGISSWMNSVTTTPSPARIQSAERHGSTVSSMARRGGSDAFPISPAKLYVPSGPRAALPYARDTAAEARGCCVLLPAPARCSGTTLAVLI